MEKFYTYIYYDPSNNMKPFYVGKGCYERAWDHLKLRHKSYVCKKIKSLKSKNIIPIIGIYAGFDEEFALFLEEELILKYGRRDIGTGILCNQTGGGEGFSGGRHTKKSKKKISEASKKQIYSEKRRVNISKGLTGRKLSEAHKKAVSEGRKGKPAWNKGLKMSAEFRKNLSDKFKIRGGMSEEAKEKLRIAHKGKKLSEEHKKNISKARSKRI